MPSTNHPRILLTGATGYIGGTVLNTLLSSLKDISISCLIRGGSDRAHKLTSTYGSRIHSVPYKGIEDLETTALEAAKHDIVINAGLGYNVDAAQALLQGLAERKAETGKEVWMIHLSGTSNLADQPLTGKPPWIEERELDDMKDNIYAYEQDLQKRYEYIQRTSELSVIDSGLAMGIKTIIMQPPTIFGIGTGIFNKISIQIPAYIRTILEHGAGVTVWKGKGVHDYVHVEDLADLYTLVLANILYKNGADLPSGKKAILFAGSGRFSWGEVAQLAAEVSFKHGKIEAVRVEDVSLGKGRELLASYLPGATDEMVEIGMVSNSRSVASIAKLLGWKPKNLEEAWKKGFEDDLKVILEE